jgi:2-oxoglutarate ferredoxin oxidoreductase subunit alpha
MNDFVELGFKMAFKYRNPAMILTDGVIGQMMEKVVLADYIPRLTDEEIDEKYGSWATNGRKANRQRNIITSLEMDSGRMEQNNLRFQEKYAKMEEEDVLFEEIQCEDAEYVLVAFGSSSRICQKAVDLAREKGIKVGLLRPITLFPFPKKPIAALAKRVKGMLVVEMNAGQMIEDVQLAAGCNIPVKHFGRMGGIIPNPGEVVEALEQKLIGG